MVKMNTNMTLFSGLSNFKIIFDQQKRHLKLPGAALQHAILSVNLLWTFLKLMILNTGEFGKAWYFLNTQKPK